MLEFEIEQKHIDNISLVQKSFREKYNKLQELNKKMCLLYKTFFSITIRLTEDFDKRVVTNDKYNTELSKLEELSYRFTTLPMPMSINNLYRANITIDSVIDIIEDVHEQLYVSSRTNGTQYLNDIFNFYFDGDFKIDSFDRKSKKLL